MLLEDILKEFLFDCELKKYSKRTIKSYKNCSLAFFVYLKNEFKTIELEDLTYKHIQQYIKLLSDRGLKESYINSIIKCLRAFFQYCVNEQYINRNPMNKIRFQKEEITLITTFNNEEVIRMVHYFGSRRYLDMRNKLIMVFLFDSGIRNNELCDIKVEDIHEHYITIHGKGKKIRHVPITPTMNKYMIKYERIKTEYVKDKILYQTEYMFLSQKGKQLTIQTVENIVRKCGEACHVRREIRCSPHTCRHYYAQSQLKNGCDIYTLSRLLGHKNINITKRYLQSMQEEDVLKAGVTHSPLSRL